MTTTRLLGAVGFTMGLTLAAYSAFAKSSYWYTDAPANFTQAGDTEHQQRRQRAGNNGP
jgi:hypothetical protein